MEMGDGGEDEDDKRRESWESEAVTVIWACDAVLYLVSWLAGELPPTWASSLRRPQLSSCLPDNDCGLLRLRSCACPDSGTAEDKGKSGTILNSIRVNFESPE